MDLALKGSAPAVRGEADVRERSFNQWLHRQQTTTTTTTDLFGLDNNSFVSYMRCQQLQKPPDEVKIVASSHSASLKATAHSRPWRSNSLTPPSSSSSACVKPIFSSPSVCPDWPSSHCQLSMPQPSKTRSHSLTMDVAQTNNHTNLMTDHSEDEKIDELIKALPPGSGMADLKDWLKSLRLHKYTRILLDFCYEDFLNLTDKTLEQRGVTMGARGKILKNVGLVKERPQALVKLSQMIENMSDLDSLTQIMRELEAIVLMPLKPSPQAIMTTSASTTAIQTVTSRAFSRADRHDSGSDSGTELGLDEPHYSPSWDTPNEMFKLLKKIYNVIMSESANTEVVAIFACILERCRTKEAFESSHKQYFVSWLQKLRALWNPPSIKKANDFKRSCRSYHRSEIGRRPSLNNFVRKSFNQNGFSPSSTISSFAAMDFVPEGSGLTSEHQLFTPFSQRHSVPEIKPIGYNQVKRFSYQEESRPMNTSSIFLPDKEDHLSVMSSSGLSPFFESPMFCRRRTSDLSVADSGCHLSSSSKVGDSRRESALSDPSAEPPGQLLDATRPQQQLHPPQFLNLSSSSAYDYRRSSEDALQLGKGHVSSTLFSYPSPSSSGYPFLNTTSTSSPFDFLSVPRRGSTQGFHHGSISSGCVSDGSTDSLLEQDLHNLSLSVTQQALD